MVSVRVAKKLENSERSPVAKAVGESNALYLRALKHPIHWSLLVTRTKTRGQSHFHQPPVPVTRKPDNPAAQNRLRPEETELLELKCSKTPKCRSASMPPRAKMRDWWPCYRSPLSIEIFATESSHFVAQARGSPARGRAPQRIRASGASGLSFQGPN